MAWHIQVSRAARAVLSSKFSLEYWHECVRPCYHVSARKPSQV
jgi:hypothetical protein